MLLPAPESLYGNSTNPDRSVPRNTAGLQISLLQGYGANEQERLLQKWKFAERSMREIKTKEAVATFHRKESD